MRTVNNSNTKNPRLNARLIILYFMLLPAVVLYTIFHYVPLPGLAIAFAKFNVGGFQEWVGLDNFQYIFGLKNFWRAFGNNWKYVVLNYLFIFPASIVLALFFNELKNRYFKSSIQTISTLPHFIAWSVVGGIWMLLLAPTNGFVNEVIRMMGGEGYYFFSDPRLFPYLYVGIAIWKGAGYGSIIYLASLAGINSELYEAAAIDGANRWKQTLHITLPGLKPTILIMFVLSFTSVLNLFEPLFIMKNPLVEEAASVLDIYIFDTGIIRGRYDLATAMGLFKSTISLALVLLSNFLSKRLTEDGQSIL